MTKNAITAPARISPVARVFPKLLKCFASGDADGLCSVESIGSAAFVRMVVAVAGGSKPGRNDSDHSIMPSRTGNFSIFRSRQAAINRAISLEFASIERVGRAVRSRLSVRSRSQIGLLVTFFVVAVKGKIEERHRQTGEQQQEEGPDDKRKRDRQSKETGPEPPSVSPQSHQPFHRLFRLSKMNFPSSDC